MKKAIKTAMMTRTTSMAMTAMVVALVTTNSRLLLLPETITVSVVETSKDISHVLRAVTELYILYILYLVWWLM